MSQWPIVRLGEIITFRGGGTPRKDVPDYWSGDVPWATVKDFKGTTLSQTQDFISRKGLKSSSANIIPAGHVIIPTRMALGKAAVNTIDMAINQDLRAWIQNIYCTLCLDWLERLKDMDLVQLSKELRKGNWLIS